MEPFSWIGENAFSAGVALKQHPKHSSSRRTLQRRHSDGVICEYLSSTRATITYGSFATASLAE
jgi:hypothetical protein